MLVQRDPLHGLAPAHHDGVRRRGARARQKHAISVQQIERWLGGTTTSPNEASKKAELKMLMMGH
jgi:hypothetical protein